MILLHGTNCDFSEIELSKCTPYKDFGKGFYLTPVRARAVERAKDKCDKEKVGSPIVQVYDFDETKLASLKVKHFVGTTEEWLNFILENRKRRTTQHDYDVVIGPVADDGVILSINLYERHVITKQALIEALTYAKPYVQYCFCTQRAIDLLQRK